MTEVKKGGPETISPKINFDASRLEYDWPQEEERYGKRNEEFCKKLNKGTPFSVVFRQKFHEGQNLAKGPSQLHYALVALGDGSLMPYPHLEQVADKKFKAKEIDAYQETIRRHNEQEESFLSPEGVTASIKEFEGWLEGTYGEQFAGVVDGGPGYPEDVEETIETGINVAKWNYKE